jgi:hypothetical protein
LTIAACSAFGSDDPTSTMEAQERSPTPTYDGPGTHYSIQATTQLHLEGVALGVGNIWEEEYTPEGQEPQRGLTALLFISVQNDSSQNRQVRVHPGQELDVPGYHLQVLAVEERYVHLAVVEVTE